MTPAPRGFQTSPGFVPTSLGEAAPVTPAFQAARPQAMQPSLEKTAGAPRSDASAGEQKVVAEPPRVAEKAEPPTQTGDAIVAEALQTAENAKAVENVLVPETVDAPEVSKGVEVEVTVANEPAVVGEAREGAETPKVVGNEAVETADTGKLGQSGVPQENQATNCPEDIDAARIVKRSAMVDAAEADLPASSSAVADPTVADTTEPNTSTAISADDEGVTSMTGPLEQQMAVSEPSVAVEAEETVLGTQLPQAPPSGGAGTDAHMLDAENSVAQAPKRILESAPEPDSTLPLAKRQRVESEVDDSIDPQLPLLPTRFDDEEPDSPCLSQSMETMREAPTAELPAASSAMPGDKSDIAESSGDGSKC